MPPPDSSKAVVKNGPSWLGPTCHMDQQCSIFSTMAVLQQSKYIHTTIRPLEWLLNENLRFFFFMSACKNQPKFQNTYIHTTFSILIDTQIMIVCYTFDLIQI